VTCVYRIESNVLSNVLEFCIMIFLRNFELLSLIVVTD
jgi:hypothetical protein